MKTFPPTKRTRVKRLHKRGHYDAETVYAVLDAGFICHVGYVVEGQPYVTPTSYWREGSTLYWHGSSASRMLRTLEAGVDCCVTVTHLDGLVVARSGFHSSINYRAAMVFGRAHKVEGAAEKEAALASFVDRLMPGRWADLRPVNRKELKATTVLAMEINEASAKIRTGGPVDDDEDYALPIWAGVVPIRQVAGAPADDERLADGLPRPKYLTDLRHLGLAKR